MQSDEVILYRTKVLICLEVFHWQDNSINIDYAKQYLTSIQLQSLKYDNNLHLVCATLISMLTYNVLGNKHNIFDILSNMTIDITLISSLKAIINACGDITMFINKIEEEGTRKVLTSIANDLLQSKIKQNNGPELLELMSVLFGIDIEIYDGTSSQTSYNKGRSDYCVRLLKTGELELGIPLPNDKVQKHYPMLFESSACNKLIIDENLKQLFNTQVFTNFVTSAYGNPEPAIVNRVRPPRYPKNPSIIVVDPPKDAKLKESITTVEDVPKITTTRVSNSKAEPTSNDEISKAFRVEESSVPQNNVSNPFAPNASKGTRRPVLRPENTTITKNSDDKKEEERKSEIISPTNIPPAINAKPIRHPILVNEKSSLLQSLNAVKSKDVSTQKKTKYEVFLSELISKQSGDKDLMSSYLKANKAIPDELWELELDYLESHYTEKLSE